MREKLSINDVHLGVIRASGTTPKTAADLRQYLLSSLRCLLFKHLDKDVIINGDLFDTFNVPMPDVLAFYQIATEWLQHSRGTCQLILGRGNHDFSKDSAKMSSFDFIAAILAVQFPGRRVVAVTEPQMIFEGIYMIPHMPNQDMFDLELSRVPADASLVLVHANYDNEFAVESDHSLNVSREQAQKLTEAGVTLIFGHEHIQRNYANIIIVGNQFPSSIADCVGNDNKKALIISCDS